MNFRGLSRRLLVCLAALVAVITFCPRAFAPWGSIHANNHSPAEGPHTAIHPAQPALSHPPQPAISHGGEINRGLAPEVARERGREGEVQRHVEIEHDAHNWRHLDIDADRHRSYFWYGYHPGVFINVLPPDSIPLYVGGAPYYYDQGVYYQSSPSGYVVVTPPVGAMVPALPPGAEAVAAGSVVYYYAAGAFYLPQPQGYLVVAPPIGVTVTALPPGATPVIINGVQYYQAVGAYYLPVMQGGVIVYATVQP